MRFTSHSIVFPPNSVCGAWIGSLTVRFGSPSPKRPPEPARTVQFSLRYSQVQPLSTPSTMER